MNPRPRPIVLALSLLSPGCGSIATSIVAPATDAAADAGAPPDVTPLGRRERCNAVDDDLDGRVDEGCPIRLTNDPSDDLSPTLSGTTVAWLRTDPRTQDPRSALYTRDVGTLGERRLAESALLPSVAGGRVVFYEGDGCTLFDLAAGTSAPVARGDRGASTFRQRCVMVGDLIVWSETRDTMRDDYDVWVVDARTNTPRQLTTEPAQQWRPVTDGRFVAWLDSRRAPSPGWPMSPTLFDVFAADATDGAPAVNLTQLASGANALAVGAVDAGRALVLEQYDAPGGPPACAVAVYDIRTRARRELSRGASVCVDVPWALSGDLAVVERSPVGASDLWLYDLRGGAPRQVTRHSRRSTGARLAGSWLVWTDDRNDQWDLYAMDLTDLDRGDFSPEGVTP